MIPTTLSFTLCILMDSSFWFDTINMGLYISRGVRFVFVCFVALSPKSTAMVMAGRSVHLNTLFPGQA